MSKLIVVNGGLMRGQSAHWKLKGATFLEEVQTAPFYRLYSIGNRYPAMLRDDERGVAIAAELYQLSDEQWQRVEAAEPPGLYCGTVELADGRMLPGILGERSFVAVHGQDISDYRGWAAYPYRDAWNRTEIDPTVPGFELFVNGTLMRNLQLHANLRSAPFLGEYRTEPRYRLHSIGDVHPGMYRLEADEPGGTSISGELYFVADTLWPDLEAGEPPHLYRGRVRLHDGSEVWGILYPREQAEGQHPDISHFGGWRAYIAQRT